MTYNELTDTELIRIFLEGNNVGIETLFNRYQDRLYSYVYYLVKKSEIAEDIYQDTFLKAFTSIQEGKYKDNNRFFYWISRIAHNKVIDYFRSQKKTQWVHPDDDGSALFEERDTEGNIEFETENKELISQIKHLIDGLPFEQKEVLVMRYYLDMSFKEIAAITGVSINTALGRMRYALGNMKNIIKKKNLKISL